MSTIIFLVGYGVPYFETYLLFTYVQEDNDDAIIISFSHFIYAKLKTKNKGQSASVLITLLITHRHTPGHCLGNISVLK